MQCSVEESLGLKIYNELEFQNFYNQNEKLLNDEYKTCLQNLVL